jgi:hypothetical protein
VPVPKCFQEHGETFERINDMARDGKQFLSIAP